jgi:tripartite-type tricarboxylate transporter receptor subunit TctC
VPYKGSAASLNDLVAGNVSMMFVDILSAMPHVKTGRLRIMGVTGFRRAASVPDHPTLDEAGITGFNGNSWLGLVAPAGTPKEIVARLSAAAANALRTPEIRERFTSQGVEPVGSTPEQYAAFIEAEIPRWAEAARAARITPQ